MASKFLAMLAICEGQRQRPSALRHTGYAGPRRTLLVVDNEEADRRLLVEPGNAGRGIGDVGGCRQRAHLAHEHVAHGRVGKHQRGGHAGLNVLGAQQSPVVHLGRNVDGEHTAVELEIGSNLERSIPSPRVRLTVMLLILPELAAKLDNCSAKVRAAPVPAAKFAGTASTSPSTYPLPPEVIIRSVITED